MALPYVDSRVLNQQSVYPNGYVKIVTAFWPPLDLGFHPVFFFPFFSNYLWVMRLH